MKRRRFLKTASATALAVGAGPAVLIPGRAQPTTLKIARQLEFVADYNSWFDQFAKTWGEQHNIQVIVDWIKGEAQERLEQEEITAQQGHDLFDTYSPPDEHVIDHREIYQECERRYGRLTEAVRKNAYNPKLKKYIKFVLHYGSRATHYRKDLWDTVGGAPDTWNDVRYGGRRIKLLHDHPVGLNWGLNSMGTFSLLTLLAAFGGSIQDIDNRPVLKSMQTLEALRFGKVLFEEAMIEESLISDMIMGTLNILSGSSSLTFGSPLTSRIAENKRLPIVDQLAIAKPPEGPAGRHGIMWGSRRFVIWKFANNIDAAKQFLVDYVGASRDAFLASKFYLFPAFPQTVPDIQTILANDASVTPPDKYRVFANAADWTRQFEHPGYANPANLEVMDAQLIPKMFAHVATGRMTPEEALTQADEEVRQVFDKWRALGKV